jgi:Leucine-rich repeat (LRR) protein
MMDPKVTSIIAAGYSEAQAKEALANNNGDMDDAIDYLFLKGRKSLRNVASTPAFDDEDVTVTDGCLAPSAAAASSSGTTVIAGQVSQTRRSSDASSSYYTTPSLGVAVIESSTSPTVRDYSSAAARRLSGGTRTSRTLNDVDPEPGLIPPPRAPPLDASNQEGTTSVSAASTKSTVRQTGSISSEPIEGRLPGAFAVGATSVTDQEDIDDSMAVSMQPSLREITTAELVDPDQENQILEQRLQEELERERENAAVAEVVKESELKKCPWRRIFCVVGVVSVTFVIALSLSLKFARPPKTVETATPTPAPTFGPPPQELIDLIAPMSFDGGESLMDPYSPQSAAARWLADNAELASYSDQRKLQRYALATFYFSTNGDAWKDKQKWLNDANECTDWWLREFDGDEDVKLDCDANNAIQYLYVQDNNLAGSLPDEIAFLSNSLYDLRLGDNRIDGNLPSSLGVMIRLKALYLTANNITGPIPTELGLMSSLQELKLEKNLLTGTIPMEMALLTALEDLHLDTNTLVGTISPTMIGSLRLLDTLRLSENNFSSTIPTEIGLLSVLEELKLHRNKLVGKPIPLSHSPLFFQKFTPSHLLHRAHAK